MILTSPVLLSCTSFTCHKWDVFGFSHTLRVSYIVLSINSIVNVYSPLWICSVCLRVCVRVCSFNKINRITNLVSIIYSLSLTVQTHFKRLKHFLNKVKCCTVTTIPHPRKILTLRFNTLIHLLPPCAKYYIWNGVERHAHKCTSKCMQLPHRHWEDSQIKWREGESKLAAFFVSLVQMNYMTNKW